MPGYSGQPILFHENEFYSFSFFSAFRVTYRSIDFDTREQAFQAAKFLGHHYQIVELIMKARSAPECKKIAREFKAERDPDWDKKKVEVFEEIQLHAVDQHEYIRVTLLGTGKRRIIENSPDPFWGWGTDRRGLNQAGLATERVRARLETRGTH